jgi:hypothetical protein
MMTRIRITAAVVFALASLVVLASPAMASAPPATPVHRIALGVPACQDPNNICLGHGTFPMGVFFLTAKARFVFQGDGNLVDYDENGRARWASFTDGRGAICVFQNDGNLVVYNSAGNPLWNSVTNGHPNDYLVVQGDGNVVIYDPGDHPIWATNTNH